LTGSDMTTRRDRLMRGLLAADGATVVLAFIGGCAYATMLGRGHGGNVRPVASLPLGAVVGIGAVVALATALIAAVTALVLALPLFAFLLRHKVSSAIAYLGAGVFLALVLAAIFAAAHYFADFLIGPDFLFGLLAIAISGPLVGVMFWIVAVRREPAL
jgi:hypothetical protein